ncbi:hypothetical protein [Paraflavitalea pollutisoli]|uniref:hypothetical protein n=1 Tax=Paraflavitalea pollutisoli TaxID=3034143 RepID=UPI0023EBEF93|nr:hypothetical protein [Paraflavitalea sp. H1-2-19X]
MKKDKIELIVVFKKDISESAAEEKLTNTGSAYRSGMDSSRGKLYFYSTGPKFILTLVTEMERSKVTRALEGMPEIHEVYTPDWTKCKD